MSIVVEGRHASFVGFEEQGRTVGDRCLVLDVGARVAVRWVTGEKAGAYDEVEMDDLVGDRAPILSDPFHDGRRKSGRVVDLDPRSMVAARGVDAVVSAMEREGHFAHIVSAATETLVEPLLASVRSDPAIEEVLASLEEEDGREFVTSVVSSIVRRALTEVA